MRIRRGFTLLEMLISTALLSLVLLGLYGALNMQKRSNKHLFDFLNQALEADRGAMVLYRDIFESDGNITLVNGEFDRLCLESTSHSLHGLSQAKVCWVVAKENRALLRIEGNGYRLPLRSSDGVVIDEVMKPMALFDIQKDKKNVLVALQQLNRDPYTFLVQGIEPPPKIIKKKSPPKTGGKKGKGGTQKNSPSQTKDKNSSRTQPKSAPKNPIDGALPEPEVIPGEMPEGAPENTEGG